MKNKLVIFVLSALVMSVGVQGLWRDKYGRPHRGEEPVESDEQSLAETAAIGVAKVGKWVKETGEQAAGAAERQREQAETRAERVRAQQETDRERGEQMRQEQEQAAERRKKRRKKQAKKDRKRGEHMRRQQEENY